MKRIEMELNGHLVIATVKWVPDNKWSVAHYEVFLSVPFQNSKLDSLFVYDKEQLELAIEKAKQRLEMELARCTLCG